MTTGLARGILAARERGRRPAGGEGPRPRGRGDAWSDGRCRQAGVKRLRCPAGPSVQMSGGCRRAGGNVDILPTNDNTFSGAAAAIRRRARPRRRTEGPIRDLAGRRCDGATRAPAVKAPGLRRMTGEGWGATSLPRSSRRRDRRRFCACRRAEARHVLGLWQSRSASLAPGRWRSCCSPPALIRPLAGAGRRRGGTRPAVQRPRHRRDGGGSRGARAGHLDRVVQL